MVEETLLPGASVAKVALRFGVNANQVLSVAAFVSRWQAGNGTGERDQVVAGERSRDEDLAKPEPLEVIPASSGAIHIELPGEIRISLEGNVDPAVVRAVLKSLRS